MFLKPFKKSFFFYHPTGWLSFNNHCRKECIPFVVYADLECILKKTGRDPNMSKYRSNITTCLASDITLIVRTTTLSIYHFRCSNDCVAWFTEEFRSLAYNVNIIVSANVPMADVSRDDWQKFNSAKHCHVCEKPFAPDDTRVRDHYYLTGI